jgi:hypothetical protein
MRTVNNNNAMVMPMAGIDSLNETKASFGVADFNSAVKFIEDIP